ncbi:MAG: plasmid maintenance system killer protein [Marmoricola sp.]|nr:plasmid maintenance system killer protein [Marmoricola sp.]
MTGLKVDYGGDRKLEKLCTDEAEMQKKRADIAYKLKLRIKALEAADTVADLETDDPLGYWHQLPGGSYPGCWAGKLSGNYRLLIRPLGEGDPWDAEVVAVIEIVDYH